MVDLLASKAILLTHQIGVQKKVVAYSTLYNEVMTLEEQYQFVDPTIELRDKVRIESWNVRPLTYVE